MENGLSIISNNENEMRYENEKYKYMKGRLINSSAKKNSL